MWNKVVENAGPSDPDTPGTPLTGDIRLALLDARTSVSDDEWKAAGVRLQDFVLLEALVNGDVDEGMAVQYEDDLRFLEGVVTILEKLSVEQLSVDHCSAIASGHRDEIEKLLRRGKGGKGTDSGQQPASAV